jgi:hypothetical protein
MTFIRESVARILTPLMQTALSAMCHGALEHTAEGWRSSTGRAGIWNSHSIRWLANRQFCLIEGKRATITRQGKQVLVELQGWAA